MDAHTFTTRDEKFHVATFNMKAGERGCPPHEHGYAHEAFVVTGTVKFSIGTIEKVLEAPSTVCFPPNTTHWFSAESDAVVVCTHEAKNIPAE